MMRFSLMADEGHSGARRETSAELIRRLESVAITSDFLVRSPVTESESGFRLERFIFEGPHGGGDPIRIGLFAGIHGDEQAGSHAIVEFARKLVRDPRQAEGYQLYLYPVCNPAGFDAGSRYSATGKDLNREFWKSSAEPEVVLLEREIQELAFHGLVSLHADDTSDGLYGFVRGAVLARSLLEPALCAAERILPRNCAGVIDGFAAENGIISHCYDGILTSPPKLENTPFEIILETPQHATEMKQVEAFVSASMAILTEYRKFIAFAADL
jgi:predicted deacylase